MKRDNKAGPALLGDVPELKEYDVGTVSKGITEGNLIFVDTRDRASYLDDYVPGSLFIPWGGSFTTYASYVILPESDKRNIVLLANDQAQANDMRDALIRVGIDNVVGYVTSTQDFDTVQVATISPAELAAKDDAFVLDVRTANEYAEGHIDGATQLHAGRVVYKRDTLPQDQTMVVHCQAGGRASVAASALRHFGFEVLELQGSFEGWQAYQNEQTVPA
jgi:hydroxyacylglutathione hydrolase